MSTNTLMGVYNTGTSTRQMKCSDDKFSGILHIIKYIYSLRCVLANKLDAIFCAIVAHTFMDFHQSEFACADNEHTGFFILKAWNISKGQVVRTLSPPIRLHFIFMDNHIVGVPDSVYDHLSELVAFDSHKSSQIKRV